ncbi:uncharacterized protein LOC113237994 [Hyposmocoma kahamanoa]|uniref:uncharacterized protein LOC113237994 n=1 Tax=Hyposmocoma kahamanoa TaxID=1477025 RepID=UPI000E6D8E32|nr:uncharacterized protein LOC113237994 [Hyposmocoma kahamanoa]
MTATLWNIGKGTSRNCTRDKDWMKHEDLVQEDKNGPAILKEEFMKALKGIQNGKAAGDDKIHIEMIKYSDCDLLIDETFNLIQEMYMTGQIPNDFQITKTVTLPKKLNTLKYEEHTTLGIISHSSKILLKIIQIRITSIAEQYLGSDQYGFRQNRGTQADA